MHEILFPRKRTSHFQQEWRGPGKNRTWQISWKYERNRGLVKQGIRMGSWKNNGSVRECCKVLAMTRSNLFASSNQSGKSKALYASSWINMSILSWLLPKKSLFKNQTFVTCSFILMKIKWFSCETFCTRTLSQKQAKSNPEVEVKSACKPSGPSDRRLSRFL